MFKIIAKCLDLKKPISEEEINSVSPYLFCRWLSGNQYTILASNELNKYYNEIPFLNQFMMIRKTFGGKIKFIPFPKTLKDEESNEIKCLEKYFKISYNKAKEYLELISEEELRRIVEMYKEI